MAIFPSIICLLFVFCMFPVCLLHVFYLSPVVNFLPMCVSASGGLLFRQWKLLLDSHMLSKSSTLIFRPFKILILVIPPSFTKNSNPGAPFSERRFQWVISIVSCAGHKGSLVQKSMHSTPVQNHAGAKVPGGVRGFARLFIRFVYFYQSGVQAFHKPFRHHGTRHLAHLLRAHGL